MSEHRADVFVRRCRRLTLLEYAALPVSEQASRANARAAAMQSAAEHKEHADLALAAVYAVCDATAKAGLTNPNDPIRIAACDAALALCVSDSLTDAELATMYAPFASVIPLASLSEAA